MEEFERTELLIGKDNLKKLQNSSVAVFGVGGVGGFVVEALARSGVSNITVFDSDKVSLSNINRQIIATVDTVGQDKVDAIKNRVLSINPNAKVTCNKVFYLPDNADEFCFSGFDYIVDAVDTVSAKLEIIERAKKENIPIISSMGTGGKLNPQMLKVTDISKTQYCPLAKVMRKELKNRNIFSLKVVYSEEKQVKTEEVVVDRKVIPSMMFVPAVAGIMIAGEVVSDLIKKESD